MYCITVGEEVDSTYVCHSYIKLLIVQGCVVCEGVLCAGCVVCWVCCVWVCLMEGAKVKGVFHEACAVNVIAFFMEAVSLGYV